MSEPALDPRTFLTRHLPQKRRTVAQTPVRLPQKQFSVQRPSDLRFASRQAAVVPKPSKEPAPIAARRVIPAKPAYDPVLVQGIAALKRAQTAFHEHDDAAVVGQVRVALKAFAQLERVERFSAAGWLLLAEMRRRNRDGFDDAVRCYQRAMSLFEAARSHDRLRSTGLRLADLQRQRGKSALAARMEAFYLRGLDD